MSGQLSWGICTVLTELVTGTLTPNQDCCIRTVLSSLGMVTPFYWPGTSDRLCSHPKQIMEELQTAVSPSLGLISVDD